MGGGGVHDVGRVEPALEESAVVDGRVVERGW